MNRRAFTLVEIIIVVVVLGILALIVIPQFGDSATVLSEEERAEALSQVLSENLGAEWEDAKPGDLAEWGGKLYVIQNIWSNEIRFHSGLPHQSFTRLDIRHHLPQREPVLFKQDDPEFEEAMRRFIRQVAGLPTEIPSEED